MELTPENLRRIVLSYDLDGCYVCTVQEAINIAKDVAAKDGHTYASDETALDDYLTVHWSSPILSRMKSWIIRMLLNL